MMVDYYLLRRQSLDRDAHSNSGGGAYQYGNGWNEMALSAFGIAAVFKAATMWLPFLSVLSGCAWVLDAILGGVIFHRLSVREIQTD